MEIEALFRQYSIKTHPVVKFKSWLPLDLSADNTALSTIDLNSEIAFGNFIFDQIKASDKAVGIGGYGENRDLYSRSDLFEGEEPRTIHLGIDIWAKAGTQVYCPFDGEVHSFANRNTHGDYGPVIILKHQFDNHLFYSLYGHLSKTSIDILEVGHKFFTGDRLATMGKYEENFHWPPHLHFQLMKDIESFSGDYPGVCKASEKEKYLFNCPNPSFLI
ncbi:peptidoglycan DD-metalloendopeptidase family protein [Roseivirga sp.]|uniref:peptidoglycan DD-metalloendopeptidase family protein n=1 Tax=Roseivirga sp. TaxID=1964215 RepID=UPI003B8B5F3C